MKYILFKLALFCVNTTQPSLVCDGVNLAMLNDVVYVTPAQAAQFEMEEM